MRSIQSRVLVVLVILVVAAFWGWFLYDSGNNSTGLDRHHTNSPESTQAPNRPKLDPSGTEEVEESALTETAAEPQNPVGVGAMALEVPNELSNRQVKPGPEEEPFELVLRGRVVDQAGAGLPGATLVAAKSEFGWSFPRQVTGAGVSKEEGRFEFPVRGLILKEQATINTEDEVRFEGFLWEFPDGLQFTFAIEASLNGYANALAEVSFLSREVEAGFADTIIMMSQPATLSGVVLNEEGQPVPKAHVRVRGPMESVRSAEQELERGLYPSTQNKETTCDEAGRFTFANVAAGEWEVIALAPETASLDPFEIELIDWRNWNLKLNPLKIQTGTPASVPLAAIPIVRVALHIENEDIGTLRISLERRDRETVSRASVFHRPSSAEHFLRGAELVLNSERNASRYVVWNLVQEVRLRAEGYHEVVIPSPNVTDGVADLGSLRFEPLATATLRIIDNNGLAQRGVAVHFLPDGVPACYGYAAGLYQWRYPNERMHNSSRFGALVNGLWRRDVVKEGEVLTTNPLGEIPLRFPPNGELSLSIHGSGFVPKLAEIKTTEVVDGVLELVLAHGGSVEGVLPAIRGVSVAGTEVFLVKEGTEFSGLGSSRRDELHLGAPYLLFAKGSTRFRMDDIPEGRWNIYALFGDLRMEGEPLEILPGQTSSALFATADYRTIRGKVTGPDGLPAAGARVWVSPKAYALNSPDTAHLCDAYGNFEIGVLPGGEQYLMSEFDKTLSYAVNYQVPLNGELARSIAHILEGGSLHLDYTGYLLRTVSGRILLNGQPLFDSIKVTQWGRSADVSADGHFSLEFYGSNLATLRAIIRGERTNLFCDLSFGDTLSLENLEINIEALPVRLSLIGNVELFKELECEVYSITLGREVANFVESNEEGHLAVSFLPEGEYELRITHTKGEKRKRRFTIGADSTVHSFTWDE